MCPCGLVLDSEAQSTSDSVFSLSPRTMAVPNAMFVHLQPIKTGHVTKQDTSLIRTLPCV